jgi:hypothetical protein
MLQPLSLLGLDRYGGTHLVGGSVASVVVDGGSGLDVTASEVGVDESEVGVGVVGSGAVVDGSGLVVGTEVGVDGSEVGVVASGAVVKNDEFSENFSCMVCS